MLGDVNMLKEQVYIKKPYETLKNRKNWVGGCVGYVVFQLGGTYRGVKLSLVHPRQ